VVLTAKLLIKFENIRDMQNCRRCKPPPSTRRLYGEVQTAHAVVEVIFIFLFACLCACHAFQR